MYSVGEIRNRLLNSTGRKLRLFVVDPDRDRFGLDEASPVATERTVAPRKPARVEAQPVTEPSDSPAAAPAALALSALVHDPVPASAIAAAERLGLSEEKLAIIGGVPLAKVQGLKAGEDDVEAWAGLLKKAEQWLAMLGHG